MSIQIVGSPESARERHNTVHLHGWSWLSTAIFLLDVLSIVSVAVISGLVPDPLGNVDSQSIENYVFFGGVVAVAYTLPFLFREEYKINVYLEGRRVFNRMFLVWNAAVFGIGIAALFAKPTVSISGSAFAFFYIGGMLALMGVATLVRLALVALFEADLVSSRRIMLCGPIYEVHRAEAEIEKSGVGLRVVATHIVPNVGCQEIGANVARDISSWLHEGVLKATAFQVNDIIILGDWSRTDVLSKIIETFRLLPIRLHIGFLELPSRISEMSGSRCNAVTTFLIKSMALGPLQVAGKRTFDLVVAAAALILLSPLFAMIALAIKTNSSGPIFFRQRRRGHKGCEFRIWKFRTMTVLDDGSEIVQAHPGDARVTSVGRFLRRYNLDELPQLINVVLGEMSLVGPRPHALAHDSQFMDRFASYPSRFIVKPGITGWAQVNGLRGLTDTEEKMRARLDYDLYYIDNWSLLFDLYIMALTILSPTAYRNAH